MCPAVNHPAHLQLVHQSRLNRTEHLPGSSLQSSSPHLFGNVQTGPCSSSVRTFDTRQPRSCSALQNRLTMKSNLQPSAVFCCSGPQRWNTTTTNTFKSLLRLCCCKRINSHEEHKFSHYENQIISGSVNFMRFWKARDVTTVSDEMSVGWCSM